MTEEQIEAVARAIRDEDAHYHATVVAVGEYLAAAKAALAAMPDRYAQGVADERARVVAWQPIETAPRDGTVIDVWVGGEFPRRIADVQWREPTDSEWWVHGGDTIEKPDATWHDTWGPFGKDSTATHWQPLPAPPAIERGEHMERKP